jgi:hypothetical protein
MAQEEGLLEALNHNEPPIDADERNGKDAFDLTVQAMVDALT